MKKNAKRKTAAKTAKKTEEALEKTALPASDTAEKKQDEILIDFPKNNEEISSGTGYTVRIHAAECEAVEISINDSDWMPCRNASGYWWFDWDETEPGKYKIYARMLKKDGETVTSKRRLCKIA